MSTEGTDREHVNGIPKPAAADHLQPQKEVVDSSCTVSPTGSWKWKVRQRIWDMMERTKIARFPRPVHHRIPNFEGAEVAGTRLAAMSDFVSAKVVKVDPDSPLKQVRLKVLSAGQTLLTPQPRLRTGFFSRVHKDYITSAGSNTCALLEAATSAGVVKYGQPISLDEKIKVDLLVVGSVAVARTGARIGKGEGFSDLEYGMLRWMGSIDDCTLVVTTVHDQQLVPDEDIPVDELLEYDVPVDIVVTPTQTIFTNTTIPKPKGILWPSLSPQKLSQIRILQELKVRIERQQGAPVALGMDEVLPPTAQRNGPASALQMGSTYTVGAPELQGERRERGKGQGRGRGYGKRQRPALGKGKALPHNSAPWAPRAPS